MLDFTIRTNVFQARRYAILIRNDTFRGARWPIREFLEWVHEKATSDGDSHAGRTANKAREDLRSLLAWAGEQEYVEKLPSFPEAMRQRDMSER